MTVTLFLSHLRDAGGSSGVSTFFILQVSESLMTVFTFIYDAVVNVISFKNVTLTVFSGFFLLY